MVKATVGIAQWYCVLCVDFIVVKAKLGIAQWNSFVSVEFIFITTIDIVQLYCVVCLVYCGYSNNRYSAMIL